MTMALVYRNRNEAFFLQDFRITHQSGKQIDAMMKFITFDKRIGMFFAGDVTTIKRIIPQIQSVESKITIDNILNEDGPMARKIESYMMNNLDGLTNRRIEIIGFIIDQNKNNNECFYINAITGMGSKLEPVNYNEVKVIGSGKHIGNISTTLTGVANNSLYKGYSIDTAAKAVNVEIKSIFQQMGVSFYNKLGISPIFVRSILHNDSFEMIGEEINVESFTTDFNVHEEVKSVQKFVYSFTRHNGKIVLIDKTNGNNVEVKEAEDYIEIEYNRIFDPENIMNSFDPSKYVCNNGVAYIINQWVVGDGTIHRTIDRTKMIDGMLDYNYFRIAEDIKIINDIDENSKYVISGKYGLIVPEQLQSEFEIGLSTNLFNHDWMMYHVENYSYIYN